MGWPKKHTDCDTNNESNTPWYLISPAYPRPLTTSQLQELFTLGLVLFIAHTVRLYIAEAMAHSGGDWGIIGVNLMRPDQRGFT